MSIRNDSTYMEPKPLRWAFIHCFDCKKDVRSKAVAADKHRGHDVDYLDDKRERMA